MVVIVLKKEWIQEMGSLATDLLVAKHSDSLSLLYATKTEMEYPFIFCNVARTKKEHTFMPIHIPVEVVRGALDMTEAEEKRLGF